MSTLQVENLIGPTSGSNANKVIIPSGQTLDASGGTLVPSIDQIVQEKVGTVSSRTDTSSLTYVATSLQVSITPKYANSLIRLHVNSSMSWEQGGTTDEYCYCTIFRNSTNIGISSGDTLLLNGAYASAQNYARPMSFGTVDTPNTTSTIVYKMYVKITDVSDTARVNDSRMVNNITATEIKQ